MAQAYANLALGVAFALCAVLALIMVHRAGPERRERANDFMRRT